MRMSVPVWMQSFPQAADREIPEIRVWYYPHKEGRVEQDSYKKFSSFEEAIDFIREHPTATNGFPLVLYGGWEMDLSRGEVKDSKGTAARRGV